MEFAALKLDNVDCVLCTVTHDLRAEVLETNRAVDGPHVSVGLTVLFIQLKRFQTSENEEGFILIVGGAGPDHLVVLAEQLILPRVRPAAALQTFVE